MIKYLVSKLIKKGRLVAIKDSSLHRSVKIHSGSSIVNCSIGKYSYCGYDCQMINTDIGNFCSIAGFVSIGLAAHPSHFVSTSPVFLSHRDSVKTKFADFDYLPQLRTKIDHDVWIGEKSLIKSGVSIGAGAIIGMGAVVTKDVPPYAVVAGNPAKIIKMRFSSQIIEALLEMRWWDLDDEQLLSVASYFNDPELMLRKRGLI